jgi:hypothetical protein
MSTRIRPARNWLLFFSFAGFLIFLLVGVISLIAYFQLAGEEVLAYGWRDPLDATMAVRVRPDLALLPLAGVPIDAAAREALAAGEPDSAFVAVVYASGISSAMRGGLFALIGDRYAVAGRSSDAALCFQLAHDLAALSPDLADAARFDLSLSAARGRLAVRDEAGLVLSLEQAESIIRFSSFLQPVQRRQTLEQLVRLTVLARGAKAATQLRASMADVVTLRPSPAPAVSFIVSFAQPLPPNPALDQTRRERQQRALALSDQWIALGGEDVGPETRDLAEFLLREDEQRIAWYSELGQTGNLIPGQRASLLSDQITWLLVKLQIARGGFGVSLVPEWEQRELEIRQAVATVQLDLFSLMREQAGALTNEADKDQAALELVRTELATWRWGQYPGLNVADREALLVTAVQPVRQRFPDRGASLASGILPEVRDGSDRRDYLLVGGVPAQP